MRVALHLIVIDKGKDTLNAIQECLAETTSEFRFTLWDANQGMPANDLEWHRYDVLLIDYGLAEVSPSSGASEERNTNWLARLRQAFGISPDGASKRYRQ